MGKKDKAVDAIVKEDAEVMTTQDEGVIANEPEKVGDVNETGNPEAAKVEKVETKDEEINKVGIDVETLKRPEAEYVEEGVDITEYSAYEIKEMEEQIQQLRGAIVYAVKSIMTPADLEDFKTLFPGLM